MPSRCGSGIATAHYPGDNPVPCPPPLGQVRYFCDSVAADSNLDSFMGSGTTGVATILAGKMFVAIEQVEEYFEYGGKRIAEMKQNHMCRMHPVDHDS